MGVSTIIYHHIISHQANCNPHYLPSLFFPHKIEDRSCARVNRSREEAGGEDGGGCGRSSNLGGCFAGSMVRDKCLLFTK